MEQIPVDISLYILRFMITVPDLIWKFSFVQKPWMILQRLDRPIILDMSKKQESERARRDAIPKGECIYFDEAYERGMKLLGLELSKLDVNMFSAVNNSLINDGCGLYRGRLILPYEHLSRFQNDLID